MATEPTTKKATRRRKSDYADTITDSPPPTPTSSNNTDSSPSTKRKAEAASQTESEEPVSKLAKHVSTTSMHPVFWNLDGNIIVQIEQMRFKLHRSWLVKHSTFFQAVFQDTYNGDRARLDQVNGDTVCYISGTTVEDFAALLTALDKAITFYYDEPSFAVMASILRASTSLEFPDFRTWVVRYFEEYWSDNLDDVTDERLEDAAETVTLGREYNIPGVLKRAFYELLRTARFGQCELGDSEYGEEEDKGENTGDNEEDSSEDDGESSSDDEEDSSEDDGENSGDNEEDSSEDDGSNGGENDEESSEANGSEKEGGGECGSDNEEVDGDESEAGDSVMTDATAETTNTELTVDGESDYPISQEDIRRLIHARERLTDAWVTAAASITTSFPCPDKANCMCRTSSAWTKIVHNSGIFKDYLYDPICGLGELIGTDWKSERFNPACAAVRIKAWKKQRQTLWDNLDLWLDL